MRKSYIAILAALLAAGCAKDNADSSRPEDNAKGVSFTASVTSDDTRTSYQDTQDAFTVSWIAGDRIGIFAQKGETSVAENIPYSAKNSGKSSDFEWTNKKIHWADQTSAHDFYAYYPYNPQAGESSTAVKIDVPIEQERGGTQFSHISDYDFMYSASTGLVKSDEPVKLSFKHALSIISVNLTSNMTIDVQKVTVGLKDSEGALAAENAAINLATGQIDCSEAKTSSSVSFIGPVLVVKGSSTDVMLLALSGHAGKTLEITAEVNGKQHVIATKTVPAEGLQGGKMYIIKGTITADEADEKQVVNLSADESANCYVVNKAATTYKFRADVAGNGYMPALLAANGLGTELAPASARLLRTWVASSGYKNGTTDGTDPTMSKLIKRTSVQLQFEDGVPYVFFDTPAEEDFAAGNAVICATDKDGTIIWSWHIWVTPDWKIGRGDITLLANDNCETAVIMDRNLGALSNGSDAGYTAIQNAQAACGLLYQWGRKDPLAGVGIGTDFDPMGNYQTLSGEILRTKGVCNIETAAGSGSYETKRTYVDASYTLAASVAEITANPEYFYTPFGNKGGTSYGEYWATVFAPRSMDNTIITIWGNPGGHRRDLFSGTKTAYDPCPAGYRIPDANVFSFLVRSGSLTLASSTLFGGDLNALNIDYSKTPWVQGDDASKSRVNVDATRGIYAYTCSTLESGQTAADRTNTTSTFIPLFGRWWYDNAVSSSGTAMNRTVFLTTDYSSNSPGITLNMNGGGNMVSFGSDGGHTECCPVRCMRIRQGQTGDPNQIDGDDNRIDDMNKWNSWTE